MEEKNVKIIARRSDGQVFYYNSENWGITHLDGIDLPETEIFLEPRGFGHGDIITGKRKHSREITITASRREFGQSATDRIRAIAFHNSNYTFELEINYLGIVRIAKNCEIKSAKYPSPNIYDDSDLTLIFLSPYYELFSNNIDTTDFSSVKALWHDTRYYNGSSGTLAFGEKIRTTEKVINYLGSESAVPIIIVKATGYVPGITLEIGTVKTTINTKLYEGDVLKIDCEKRIVYKNDKSVKMSEYSVWELAKVLINYGDNLVKVYNNESSAFMSEISYIGRYGGL